MPKAGNAVVGALRVILSADTAAFETGLKNAQSRLAGFATALRAPMLAVSAAVTGAAAAVATGVKLALNSADELSKAAQRFGVPVEQLSALKYAADLAGVSLEQLGTGLNRLAKSMASNDEIFDALKVSIENADGTLRPIQDVFIDVSEALSKMDDGAAKTAATLKIFGKSGTSLLPLLNEGAEGLRRLTEEAEQLGLVITERTGKAAEQFNDNLSRLQSVFTGIFIQIASNLAPILARLTDRLVEVAKNGDLAKAAVSAFQVVLKYTAIVGAGFIGFLQEMVRWGQLAAEVFDILGDDTIAGDFAKIGAAFTKAAKDVEQITKNTKANIEAIQNTFSTNSRENIFGDASGPVKIEVDTEDTQTELNILKETAKETKDELEGVLKEFIPEGYEELVRKGNDAIKQQEELWQDIGDVIEDRVVGAINDLIDGTLTWRSVLSDVLRSAASIISGIGSQSIQNAGGWGALLGFKDGGSFKVGGAGGIDSQFVGFMASPNEIVTVSKEDEMMGGLAFSPTTMIDARGSNVSRAEIQAMIEAGNRQLIQQLPAAFKTARAQGKV